MRKKSEKYWIAANLFYIFTYAYLRLVIYAIVVVNCNNKFVIIIIKLFVMIIKIKLLKIN